MHFIVVKVFTIVVLLNCCTTMAVQLTPRSMTERYDSSNDVVQPSHHKINTAAATLLQLQTQEWVRLETKSGRRSLSSTTTNTTCPVCGESTTTEDVKENKDNEEEEDGGSDESRLGSVIGKLKTSLNTEGSVLDTVRDNIVNITKNTLGIDDDGSKIVSVETFIPILLLAANRFTFTSQRIQGAQSTAITSDTSDLVISIYDLLESVVVNIADLLFSIIDLFADIKTTIVQFIADVILSILDVLEGIKLGIIQVIVDFLNALTGGENNAAERTLADTANDTDGPIQMLKNILSSSRLGGIYSSVITSLQERNDDSGLVTILFDSASDMEIVNEKLDTFLYHANQVMTDAQNSDESSSSSSTEVAISEDTVTQILELIVDTITTILNLVVDIIVTILNVIVDVVTAIIGLIISIITGIIELIISLLESILGIFSRQTGTTVSTSTVTQMGIMTTILTSPIYDIMICQLGLSSCTAPSEEIDCAVQALSCQNEQLA